MDAANAAPHILDNPVWYALITNHAHFAVGTGLAKRYQLEVSPLVAIAELSSAALDDLKQIVAKGEGVAIANDDLPADTAGWSVVQHLSVVQMVSEKPADEVALTEPVVDLSAEDVPEMLALIELTHPGPFLARTVELGHYIGIRKEGRLVAMAGERMYPPGCREISAVCTHPDYQGKGYAQQLVSRLSIENWQRGNVPFLHVAAENERARKIYEKLHFRVRGEFTVLVISY